MENLKEEDKDIESAKVTTKDKEDNKDGAIDLIKSIIIAGIIALGIRAFAFEPFNIPSGSMFPTLLVGDYLFVEKYSYGYSQYSFPFGIIKFKGRIFESSPKRGDVAVFRKPGNTDIDYIKRIIGLPGDKIQVKHGVLNINGKIVMRDFRNTEKVKSYHNSSFLFKKYIETLPNGLQHYIYEISDNEQLDNTKIYTVPQGHYFAMGDNRDNSMDSRVLDAVGFIPAENLIGRAWFLFFSTEGIENKCTRKDNGSIAIIKSVFCKLVEYPQAVRYKRFFKIINKI